MTTLIERTLFAAALTMLTLCATACGRTSPPPVQGTVPELTTSTALGEVEPRAHKPTVVILASQEALRQRWEAAPPADGAADDAGRQTELGRGTVLAHAVALSWVTENGISPFDVPCHIEPKLCTPDPELSTAFWELQRTQDLDCKVYEISESTYIGLCRVEEEE